MEIFEILILTFAIFGVIFYFYKVFAKKDCGCGCGKNCKNFNKYDKPDWNLILLKFRQTKLRFGFIKTVKDQTDFIWFLKNFDI